MSPFSSLYAADVLPPTERIVVARGVSGKQSHDAHLVALMILTFNGDDFNQYPGATHLKNARKYKVFLATAALRTEYRNRPTQQTVPRGVSSTERGRYCRAPFLC